MKTIAFGPLRQKIVGSWRWFGQDLAQELSKYYKIVYATYGIFPKCDLVFAVKLPKFTRLAIIKTKKPILFVSIDLFHCKEDIKKFESELKYCTVVHQCHLLKEYIPDSYIINHHAKYITDVTYKEKGYILWVGGSQYKKIALDYVKRHNLELDFKYLSGNLWSPENQLIAQSNCKAAFDIKDNDFWQRTKPPTKIVDFIASGIPVAANEYCSAVSYFKQYYNFEICSPLDQKTWLSKQYFDDIQLLKQKVRYDFSLENIGLQYKRIIDFVLSK